MRFKHGSVLMRRKSVDHAEREITIKSFSCELSGRVSIPIYIANQGFPEGETNSGAVNDPPELGSRSLSETSLVIRTDETTRRSIISADLPIYFFDSIILDCAVAVLPGCRQVQRDHGHLSKGCYYLSLSALALGRRGFAVVSVGLGSSTTWPALAAG